MAAGKQAAKDIVISYDDGSGSLQDISQYVTSDFDISVVVGTEETDSFGDQWDEHTPTGHASSPAITIPMEYDDTATTGPAIVFKINANDRDPQGTLRTLTIALGNSASTTVETRLITFRRTGKRRGLTKCEAIVQPSGAVSETP